MKVMVTGAGGMVGSHMVELLYSQGHDVLGTYYKPTTDITELDPAIKMMECDVRYYQSVLRIISEFQPEQIITWRLRVIRPFLGRIHRLLWILM